MALLSVLLALNNSTSFTIKHSKNVFVQLGLKNLNKKGSWWVVCLFVVMESYHQATKSVMIKTYKTMTVVTRLAMLNRISCALMNQANVSCIWISTASLSITFLEFLARTQESCRSQSIRRIKVFLLSTGQRSWSSTSLRQPLTHQNFNFLTLIRLVNLRSQSLICSNSKTLICQQS